MSTVTQELPNAEEITLDEVRKQAANEAGKSAEVGDSLQLIIFKLGGEEYALPIDHVKEIVITPGIAKMPQTPEYIKGVANIRGTIIAIMDLEQKFGLEKVEELTQKHNYTLVIESESHKVGILVTKVPNTLSVRKSTIDTTSSVMQYSSLDQDCIEGIVKSNDRLIILINILKMIEAENMNFANV